MLRLPVSSLLSSSYVKTKYSVDQLMELAGQAVAHVVFTYLKPGQSVYVICGPGSM